MHELIACQHQFTDQRHQIFQHFNRNANRLLSCGGFGLHRLGHRFGGAGRNRGGRSNGAGRRGGFRLGHRRGFHGHGFSSGGCIQSFNDGGIIAVGFLAMLLKPHYDFANGIHRRENQRNPLRGDFQAAITIEAEDGLAGMRHFFQP